MAKKVGADAFTAEIASVVREAQTAGARTLVALSDALNARGVYTARGKLWGPATVKNLLRRLEPPLTPEEEDFVKSVELDQRRKLSPEEVRVWITRAKATGYL
jgi:hypothetical protein